MPLPGGARIAVLVSVLMESWSEGKYPSYFPRTTALKPGATDLSAARWSEYGGNEGVWRIVRILDHWRIKSTLMCNAISAERYPDLIAQVVKSGHDVAGHGYAQDQYLLDFSPEEQRGLIHKSLDILERHAGRRPRGWTTPVYGGDRYTRDILIQEGLSWHCDALDRSAPRVEQAAGGQIVAIPWCEFVDNRVLRGSPRDYFQVYRDTFDFLYAREPGSMLHLAIHGHFGGRPLVAAMFDQILQHFASFSDVWFARHDELAQWAVTQPAEALEYRHRFFT